MTGAGQLRVFSRRELADEHALVLLAAGLAPRIAARPEGFVVSVREAEAERARTVIDDWMAERRNERPARSEAPPPPLDFQPGIAVSIALLSVFLVSGPRQAGGPWFEAGSADAAHRKSCQRSA